MSDPALDRRISDLERELHSLRDEVDEVKSEQAQTKTDVMSLKSEIAQSRVDIDRVNRRVLEATLENRRSDKAIMNRLDDMRAAVFGLVEHLQPKVIVAPQPSPPVSKDS